MQLAGGSEKVLQTEAVCEFIIVSNRSAALTEVLAAEDSGAIDQNPLERR